jgi:hypothetical protein
MKIGRRLGFYFRIKNKVQGGTGSVKRKNLLFFLWIIAAALLSACGTTKGQITNHQGPFYAQPAEKGKGLEQISLSRAQEEIILALNPEKVTDREVREILSLAPAPRIINIHGGIYPVYLCMNSFSEFLIGMGYPEQKIRSIGDGSYSFSCYDDADMIAGTIAWYYEKEVLRPMLIGHSQGGIQAVKVLHKLAGKFEPSLRVWNPQTGKKEERDWIIDPHSGQKRPVVGIQLSYTSALGAGGLTLTFPNQWSMISRLRSIPDTTVAFTGYYMSFDLLGGDYFGFGPANKYHPNGKAEVRNVKLPFGTNHVIAPVTSQLAENRDTKEWINNYRPSDEPAVDAKFENSSMNIAWAADVWHSIKKHWVLELKRVIQAKRAMANGQ